MRSAKNLFPHVTDFANLCRAYREAARGKRDRAEVRAFEHRLEPNICEIRRELEAGAFRWGAYRRFMVRDPKRREIRAAPFRDRVVHHAIFHVLDPIAERRFVDDSYACRSGRGAHAAFWRFLSFVAARRGQGWVLKLDVKSYFASVDHAVLAAQLARIISDRRVLRLLNDLICHGAEAPGRGMPIGNLTSQLFANLYLDPLDHFVKEALRVPHYLRYMDDLVVVVREREEGRARLREISEFLRGLRLDLNPRRVSLTPLGCPQDVLGYVRHPGGRIRVRRRSVRRLWHRIPILAARLADGELAWPEARASLASWLGLAVHADGFRLSRAIFRERDVRNLGHRMLVRSLRMARAGPA